MAGRRRIDRTIEPHEGLCIGAQDLTARQIEHDEIAGRVDKHRPRSRHALQDERVPGQEPGAQPFH